MSVLRLLMGSLKLRDTSLQTLHIRLCRLELLGSIRKLGGSRISCGMCCSQLLGGLLLLSRQLRLQGFPLGLNSAQPLGYLVLPAGEIMLLP